MQFTAPSSPPTCPNGCRYLSLHFSSSWSTEMVLGLPNTSELASYKSSFGICRQDLPTPRLSAGPGRLRGCTQQSHKNKVQPSIPENGEEARKCCHPSFLRQPSDYSWGNERHCFSAVLAQKGCIPTFITHGTWRNRQESLFPKTVFLYLIKWMFIAKPILSLALDHFWFFLSGPINLKCFTAYWHNSFSARPTSLLRPFPER